MRAQDVGWHNNRLTLGKLSGRSAFRERLKELGIELESEVALNSAFKKFKELADKKSEIFDEDLHAIVSDEAVTPEVEQYHLVSLTAHVETGESPYAKLIITDQGREVKCEAKGAGPVDATFKALESVLKSESELLLYSVNNVTEGTDSQGEVTVRLTKGGRVVNGIGADTDIVIASAKAYLNALNKMTATFARLNPQIG
jgi:2-isopropylmalate synthase